MFMWTIWPSHPARHPTHLSLCVVPPHRPYLTHAQLPATTWDGRPSETKQPGGSAPRLARGRSTGTAGSWHRTVEVAARRARRRASSRRDARSPTHWHRLVVSSERTPAKRRWSRGEVLEQRPGGGEPRAPWSPEAVASCSRPRSADRLVSGGRRLKAALAGGEVVAREHSYLTTLAGGGAACSPEQKRRSAHKLSVEMTMKKGKI